MLRSITVRSSSPASSNAPIVDRHVDGLAVRAVAAQLEAGAPRGTTQPRRPSPISDAARSRSGRSSASVAREQPERVGAEQLAGGAVVEGDGAVGAHDQDRVAHRLEDPARERLARLERRREVHLRELARRARRARLQERPIPRRRRQRPVVHGGQHPERAPVARAQRDAGVALVCRAREASRPRGTGPALPRQRRRYPSASVSPQGECGRG